MLEIMFILVGTFVGAGFASGKEIFSFFTIYSYAGIISSILFLILLFLLIKTSLSIKIKYQITNYNEFLIYLEKKHPHFHKSIFLFFMNLFLACSFYTMVIALSTLFFSQFQIAKIITITLTLIFCFFIFYQKNIHFIGKINSLLMPFLIIFMFVFCTKHIHLESISFHSFSSLFLIKGILFGFFYFSYNSLLLLPILFNIEIKNKKINIYKISFSYAFLIFLLIFSLNLLLLTYYSFVATADLPLLIIVNKNHTIISFFYFFIFLSAILTTMLSSGFSFVQNLKEKNWHFKICVFLIGSFVFSLFSFSNLINTFYPLFGILGFGQLILLFL